MREHLVGKSCITVKNLVQLAVGISNNLNINNILSSAEHAKVYNRPILSDSSLIQNLNDPHVLQRNLRARKNLNFILKSKHLSDIPVLVGD